MGQPYLGGGEIMHGQAPCFGAGCTRRASVRAGGASRPALIVVLLASLVLSACAGKKPQSEDLPPLGPPVAVQESPEFFVANLAPRNQDLTSWKDMAPTVRKSLRYVNSKPQGAAAVKRPGLTVTWGDLSRSLTRLRELLPRLDAEPDLLEGALRLVKLLGKPEQIPMRAPMIMRELHYLLLTGPQGGILRRLHTLGTQNNRIVRAISLLRRNVNAAVRMDDLARQVHMSVSSLHRHFKTVTGLSPLQYHKQLRLYEARRLMLTQHENASGAALAVGYESPTQFNREYKRMFGEPPHRDISRRHAQ